MSTFSRRVVIFLIVVLSVTFLTPEHFYNQAYAAQAEEETIEFIRIEEKAQKVAVYPALPPKPEPEPEPAPVIVTPKQTTYVAKAPAPSTAPLTSGNIRTVTVTAYSSTPDQTWGDPFTTASGTRVHWGTVAANFLPFGTKVRFPDYFGEQVFTIEDRTAKRFSNRADIWFPSRGEALQFGKRSLRIEIL